MIKLLLVTILSMSCLMACDSKKRDADTPITTVDYVDLDRFLGKWYVAARMPSTFESDCINSRAIYQATSEPDTIAIQNICDDIEDPTKEISVDGSAKVVDSSNAKFKVKINRFPGNLFDGDLWVVHLDEENYNWVILSDADGRYLWIMGRDSIMQKNLLAELIDWAKQDGWYVEELIMDNN